MKKLKIIFVLLIILTASVQVFSQGQDNIALANQYASTGEFDKAVIYFEKWYSSDPINAYQPYLNCLVALKDYEKAEKIIKKQIKKIPTNANLWVDLGQLYATQGKDKEADEYYSKAIKSLFPDLQQIQNLGNTFLEKKKLDFAETTYLEGRKLIGATYPFSFELAEVYSQKQQPQKMVDEYLGILEFNEAYLPNLQAILQNKIAFDTEGALSDIIRTSLLRKVQRGNQNPVYNELLYWLLLQEKDFESAFIQAKAIDKRNDENGTRIIALGKLSASNQQFDIAESCFNYVIQKGVQNSYYLMARMELIASRDAKITLTGNYSKADILALEKDYQSALTELGKNENTAPLIRSYAHLEAFYLDKTDIAISLLEETIAMPRISPNFVAECKLELGDILILNGQVWDASLYYSQVDKDYKHDAIGREGKFRNARLSYYMGEFEWAAAQLNVLKAATSQLISNDAMKLGLLIMDNMGLDSDTNTAPLLKYAHADLLAFTNHNDQALAELDSMLIEFPGHSLTDEAWFKEAAIYSLKGDYQKAAGYYEKIVATYPDDILGDDALFMLAGLTENKLNDKVKAKELYETLLTKYPGSLFAVDARKRFRILRGDVTN